MNKLTKIAATMLGVVATMGVAGLACAAPLQIVSGANPAYAEAIGDPGGSNYTNANGLYNATTGPTAGPGLPTALGGWPTPAPGFALDTGLPPGGGNNGISGWDGAYLSLAQPGAVSFQFMGMGDSTNTNVFQLIVGGVAIWNSQTGLNGTCGGGGVTPTSPNCSTAGSQVTLNFTAAELLANNGLIPFQFENLTTGLFAINDGSNNLSPDHPSTSGYPTGPGFFLGADPYLAPGTYSCGAAGMPGSVVGNAGDTCGVVYAGFTDNGFTAAGSGDHDYEDLVVRISAVPEPGSIFLLGAGLVGLAFGRRRQPRNMA